MCKKCMIEKFFHFAHTVLENREELGLTEENARKIKELKIKTKKDLIRDKADIEILAVDIFAKLWEPKVDIEGINKLIDRKYDLKAESAKRFIQAFVTLKGSLTKEQMKKAKAICKAEKQAGETEGRCCR
jgi:hypothetical protein